MPATIGTPCDTQKIENAWSSLSKDDADFKINTFSCGTKELQVFAGTVFYSDPQNCLTKSYGARLSIARSVFPLIAIGMSTKEWPEAPDELENIANPACIEFCNTRGLTQDLKKCICKAKVIFSSRCNLTAEYECFPVDEYEEEGHITIKVVIDCNQATAFQKYDAFTEWMLDNIGADKLSCFILKVERAE
jgi:hypothetical protein